MLGRLAQHPVERARLVADSNEIAHRLRKNIGVAVERLCHANPGVQVVPHVARNCCHGLIADAIAFIHQRHQCVKCWHPRAHHQAHVAQEAGKVITAHLIAKQVQQHVGDNRQPLREAPEPDHGAVCFSLQAHPCRKIALDCQAQQARPHCAMREQHPVVVSVEMGHVKVPSMRLSPRPPCAGSLPWWFHPPERDDEPALGWGACQLSAHAGAFRRGSRPKQSRRPDRG